MPIRVGIVGTGWICRGLASLLSRRDDMTISGILTRRVGPIADLSVSQDSVKSNAEAVFDVSDVVVVSTGDPIYSTAIINKAFDYGLPVVTMDAETQIISGSWLSRRGVITEANGDQPGCLAALRSEVLQMGFKPVVYGNIKGFLDRNPSLEQMQYWAQKQGYSVTSVTSFTDGTKVQVEQCLVANAFGAEIAKKGLIGLECNSLEEGACALAAEATALNAVLSDYIISRAAPPGVFIAATHHQDLAKQLSTYKMGDGPYYVLYKPTHLCFFEIPGTISRLMEYHEILLGNGELPTTSVACIAKRKLDAGSVIANAVGSMDIRGEAIRIFEHLDHLPIGLASNIYIKHDIEPGQMITLDDVELPESLAYSAWKETLAPLLTANGKSCQC
jgi:predicted homoserine dehydrogenase-like protein